MPSQCYPGAREKFLTAQLSWLSGTYRALLLPEAYVPDFDDLFLADVFAGVRIAISDALTNRTATKGVASCDPIRWGTLADTRNAAKLIIFRDSGVEATSDLIAFCDTDKLQGAPLALVGLDYFYIPNALDGGIFRL